VTEGPGPEAWQRLASETAAELREATSQLERTLEELASGGSLRDFWEQTRELNARLRTAPAIMLDDKLELKQRLDLLCERARRQQKEHAEAAARLRHRLAEQLALARDSVEDARSVADIQEVRADLVTTRRRLEEEGIVLGRRDRQETWKVWQTVNQAAWQKLSVMWEANEAALGGLLAEAQRHLDAGQPRPARDSIRAFHAAAKTQECSHAGLRRLQTLANRVWHEADELARRKHEAYVRGTASRVGHWRGLHARNAQARSRLLATISDLEAGVRTAPTDIAAAMLRGRLTAVQRELAGLESEDRRIVQRIESAEALLRESG